MQVVTSRQQMGKNWLFLATKVIKMIKTKAKFNVYI